MEDFDILYMVKTPFFLGNNEKVQEEAHSVELNEEDTKNQSILNFFIIRALTEQGKLADLKPIMQEMFQQPGQQQTV